MTEVSIEKVWSVRIGNKSWFPQCKEVMDRTFIRLQKWDRELTKAILGKALDLRATARGPNLNVKTFDELVRMRTAASRDAVMAGLTGNDDDSENEQKPAKKRRVRESDRLLAAEDWVTLTLQEFMFEDQKVGPLEARFLWGITSPELWMELSEHNVNYVVAAIQRDVQSSERGRTRQAKAKAKFNSPKRLAKRALKGSPLKGSQKGSPGGSHSGSPSASTRKKHG